MIISVEIYQLYVQDKMASATKEIERTGLGLTLSKSLIPFLVMELNLKCFFRIVKIVVRL